MMNYTTRLPSLPGARGTHYNEAPDHFFYSTDEGKVYLLPTSPAALLFQRSEQLRREPNVVNLNATGGGDLQWTLANRLRTLGGARLLALTGYSSLDSIPPSDLVDANWATSTTDLPEDGSSTTGRFYAVRIPYQADFHYAKVRVFRSGTQTRIEWAVYNVSPNPILVGAGYGNNVRDLIVSEFETVMYFSAEDSDFGGGFVFQTPRTSNILEVYPAFAPGYQPIHSIPLNDPRQMVLDGSYIYVVDSTSLWRIEIATGAQELVITGLQGGTGLQLSVEGTALKAYISDEAGRVFIVDISDFGGTVAVPLPAPAYTLSGVSGFMNWANREHTALFVTLRDTRQVVRLDLQSGVVAVEGTTSSAAQIPWSAERVADNKLYVACESEIGQFIRTIVPSNNLLLGIGLIPFDYINNSTSNPAAPATDDGKANTSQNPGYYFSAHPNLPFGGNLSLMLNHPRAWNDGIRYYSIKIRNLATNLTRSITDPFSDYKWDDTVTPPKFMGVTTTPNGGLYPVRNPDDLWYNHFLSGLLRTSVSDNGHNVLVVEFYDAAKQPVANGRFERLIFVDNTRCNAALEFPRIGTDQTAPEAGNYPTLICGCLTYTTKNDLLEVDFKAWQPQGAGHYSLSFSRGVSGLAQSGTVTSVPTLLTKSTLAPGRPVRVGHILGDCDVANVVISLSVPARVIDGFGWINLGASTYRSFTLIRGPITHTPWTSPE